MYECEMSNSFFFFFKVKMMSRMSDLISAFEPERETFKTYLNWLEAFLTVLKVKDTYKQNILIACII